MRKTYLFFDFFGRDLIKFYLHLESIGIWKTRWKKSIKINFILFTYNVAAKFE